jgi:CPA2 family monovalent cation:H+ antiporter-2
MIAPETSDVMTLAMLVPAIVFLGLGIATAIASRAAGLSPIVGYIVLGLGLNISGFGLLFGKSTVSLLAELGVIFLLFDIGLHFSLDRVRKQASDIFAFGPFQVIFATIGLTLAALAFGIKVVPALLIGSVLALSSTAVVGRLIAERHQQNCPVGLTATSILIFQDVAAIFLLIVTNSLDGGGGGSIWTVAALALCKTILAFAITVTIARLLIGPLLGLVARSRNEEVFTATALLIALAAGWATGKMGLSLTLGAFLGGIALAETPYRGVIESEIRPFRGLLLGFFFISIGLSLDVNVLTHSLPAVVGLTTLLFIIKITSNIAASRVFKWSVPGSTQLGFLLAQGSEFAFVILSLPSMRSAIGDSNTSVIIAVVALSMAVTPNLADAGRRLAGRMRKRIKEVIDAELIPKTDNAPIIIVGMGAIGRTLADALIKFGIGYYAIEYDQQRLEMAIADGYDVTFGDGFDMRMWGSFKLHERKLSVLTTPDFDILEGTRNMANSQFPNLKRYVVVTDEIEAQRFRNIGFAVVVDRRFPRGLDVAATILSEMEISSQAIENWIQEQVQSNDPVSPFAQAAA